MPGTVIFGGTAEGRVIAQELDKKGEDILVSVTSAYASELLPEGIKRHIGALDYEGMRSFLKEKAPMRVIDATHPYAAAATRNIKRCCGEMGIAYERIERPITDGLWRQYVQHVPSSESAAEALLAAPGNVLLTTGSKTLNIYAVVNDMSRVWARVLPTAEALELCRSAGVRQSHIIAMQGPFSSAFNAALYDMLDIKTMVTKDSGAQGGVEEKVLPALERDIHVIMIDRPKE